MSPRNSLPVVEPLQRALYLRSLDVFRDLPPRELVVFASLMEERWFRRGTALLTRGHPVDAIYLLVEGRVRFERDGHCIGHVTAPGEIGLFDLLADANAEISAFAESALLTLRIEAGAFLDAVEEHFSVFLALRRAIGRLLVESSCDTAKDSLGWWRGSGAVPAPDAGQGLTLAERLVWASHHPLLERFGTSVLAALVRDDCEMRCGAGTELWKRGDAATELLLVVDGRVICRGATNQFCAGPGALLGVEAAFCDVPHLYEARADTPLIALRVDVARLLDTAEDHFQVATRILAGGAALLRCADGSRAETAREGTR